MKITPPPDQTTRGADTVEAAGVTVVDSGGFYGPGLTLEEILQLIGAGLAPGAFLTVIGGGKGTVNAMGTLGATQLVDLALGNYHWGTLGEDCDLTTTGWTNGKDCQIVIELDVAGFTPTFTGFSWIGGTTPTWPASGIVHVAAFSRDGGTTIYAAKLGAASSSEAEGQTPYHIPTGETFTVHADKQVLFTMPIDVEGSLVVDGFLLEVA